MAYARRPAPTMSYNRTSYKLAGQVRDTVRERGAGRPRFGAGRHQGRRALLANAEIAAGRARRDLRAARERLAVFLGGYGASSSRASTVQFDSLSVPCRRLENLLALVPDNPDAARLHAEMQLRRSSLDLEKARDIPDLTASAGSSPLRGDRRQRALSPGFRSPFPSSG